MTQSVMISDRSLLVVIILLILYLIGMIYYYHNNEGFAKKCYDRKRGKTVWC